MPVEAPTLEKAIPAPNLLVELPSRPGVFVANLRDIFSPERLEPLELRSTPAPFWPDVFVTRSLPWSRFLQSAVYHVLAGAVLLGLSRLLAIQPSVVRQQPSFDHSQVVYYQATELPPLDTRAPASPQPRKADPEFSPQPIISVPAESDNHTQTIVAPPKIKLKRDIAMPNVVAWSDQAQKPRLAIPAAPLVPASEIRRLTPTVEDSVVAPAPDAARINRRRSSPVLQSSVVAPPPDLRVSTTAAAVQGLQPDLIAPPPQLASTPTRRLGDINIGPSNVIAPAPQLAVSEQRTAPGGRIALGMGSPQVIAPPPSAAGASSGSQGRLIALNLHPAVGAPPDPPPGNRRGSFTATPEGHAGASGAPGSTTGSATTSDASGVNGGKKSGAGSSTRTASGTAPTGLYVGKPVANAAPVAGDPASKPATNTVNPNLIASVRVPRATSSRPMQPESATKLSEAERAVFGNRKFYSLTLNMPNLNSGGGSWVIRFAELRHESGPQDAMLPPPDLSQPVATRKVDPAYPLQLMRQNVAGNVILYAVIHADGTVGDVRVLRGVDDRLDGFARDAITQWKFEPATKNGTPVDVEATFQIPFRPTRVGTSF